MTLTEINGKLTEISKALESIQWEKDKIMKEDEKSKIEDKINSVDGDMKTEKNFGKEQLETFTTAIKGAADKGKKFELDNKDVSKEKDYEIRKSTKRKIELSKTLNGKYEELFQKKEAIKKLEERFNPEELEDYANKEIENNEIEVKKKNHLSRKIKSFKNSNDVTNTLNEIEKNISEIEKLDKLKKEIDNLNKKIADLENQVSKEKDPADKKVGEDQIARLKKQRIDEAKKFKIDYDETTFDTDINNQKAKYNAKNTTARNKIATLLKSQDSDVKDAIGDLSKVDPKDIAKTLDLAVTKKDQEMIALNRENSRLKANIAQMSKDRPLGEEHYTDINNLSEEFSYEPTDEEIEESDEYKKSIEKAIIPNSGKEKIEWRRNYLLGDKVRDGKRHPLAWLRSHFGGKILDNRISKDIEEKARESAKKQIISNKKAEEEKKEAEELAAVGRNQFVRELYNEKAARAILEGKEEIIDAEIMNGFVERMSSEEKVEKEPEK